jgi:hypothetical protein
MATRMGAGVRAGRGTLDLRLAGRFLTACVAAAAVIASGCKVAEPRGAAGPGDRTAQAPAWGAVDESARRGSPMLPGDAPDIFAPLDLPPASPTRHVTGAPGRDYWHQRADYTIDCTLDADAARLTATVRLDYHNNSPDALPFLWFQLEQNLFRSDSRGSLARTPGGVMKALEWAFDGGFSVSNARWGADVLSFEIHDTLARVDLPRPIAPGEVATIEYEFSFVMPPHLRRMGSETVEQGTIFEYAQWFPHVCNYDDVTGWNTLPYMGAGEFYTNFGAYRVNITVPRGFIVTATGELTNAHEVLTEEQQSALARAFTSDEPVYVITPDRVGDPALRPAGDGPLTWRFTAENVRTFAWAASDAFIWDAAAARVGTRSVLVQSFYPREAKGWMPEHKAGGSTRHVKHAVEFYSRFNGYDYPYPHMTNVNGPEDGMEYPMIIFCGDRDDDDGPFGVTDHEVGHNWFPMIVNTDERRDMWFDEGFNSFTNIYSNAAWKNAAPDVTRHVTQTIEIAQAANAQRVDQRPDFQWHRWTGGLNYRKTALALYLLREEVLGPERFDRAWHAYVNTWAFKHPQPADFVRIMQTHAGEDLSWFWRGWFLTPGTLDQGVTAFGTLGDETGGRVYADLVNNGSMVMPVSMEVEYTDGFVETRRLPVEIWSTTNVWRAAWDAGGRTIERITLDPRSVYPDINRENNVRD